MTDPLMLKMDLNENYGMQDAAIQSTMVQPNHWTCTTHFNAVILQVYRSNKK
jgi:hypothetical protein